MTTPPGRELLEDMFAAMRGALGPSCWWPAESDFEVAVGAVLTQNTAWGNVEKAVAALREAGRLSPRAMHDVPEAELAKLIRPAGFFRVKAKRLRNLLNWLQGPAATTSPPCTAAIWRTCAPSF